MDKAKLTTFQRLEQRIDDLDGLTDGISNPCRKGLLSEHVAAIRSELLRESEGLSRLIVLDYLATCERVMDPEVIHDRL